MIADEQQARSFVAARCGAAEFKRLDQFVVALHHENELQNLVARTTLESLWQRHIADSAQLLDHVPRETPLWLDLGSGAGMPGLVVAAMRPQWRVILVESRRKRVEWLERMVNTLGLSNCSVAGVRLERVDTVPAGVISARAFAPLVRILELSERFSTSDTLWLLPKGRSAAQELRELPARQRKLFHVEQSQTDAEAGIIVGHLAGKAGS